MVVYKAPKMKIKKAHTLILCIVVATTPHPPPHPLPPHGGELIQAGVTNTLSTEES